ncbi:hypothetical protein M422DRAFT_51689 [Sphaerobolus stellatus SS14]|nr:hypothetical protein M422DRAFT_51689 [Sphaerobolus stellatus SS14]
MSRQRDGMAYFNNGKEFFQEGLLPNLRTMVVRYQDSIHDPYHALFPNFMPKSVETLHICYAFSNCWGPGHTQDLCFLSFLRRTPIRYQSTPHHLKRLIVTPGSYQSPCSYRTPFSYIQVYRKKMTRLWESLFEVDEVILYNRSLPLHKDLWSLDVNDVCNLMEEMPGFSGIGWMWMDGRPIEDSDEDEYSNDSDSGKSWDEDLADEDDEKENIEDEENADADLHAEGEDPISYHESTNLEDESNAQSGVQGSGGEEDDIEDDEDQSEDQSEEEDEEEDEFPQVEHPLRRCASLDIQPVQNESLMAVSSRHLQRSTTYNELPTFDYSYGYYTKFPICL